MRTLLFLALCLSASAAPLQSPKAASVPKSTPMTVPVTEPYTGATKFLPTFDVNFFGCDTNDSSCVLYDRFQWERVQKAGYELRVYLKSEVNEDGPLVATFGAASFDRDSGFTMHQQSSLRWPHMFFSHTQTLAPTGGFKPAAVGIVISPKFSKQVTPWSRRR